MKRIKFNIVKFNIGLTMLNPLSGTKRIEFNNVKFNIGLTLLNFILPFSIYLLHVFVFY